MMMKKNRILLLLLAMLGIATSISAQRLMHRDYISEVKAAGMTEERAKKVVESFHPLLLHGHPSKKVPSVTGNLLPPVRSMSNKVMENTKFYGYMAYSKAWTEDLYGLYSFVPSDNTQFERLAYGEDGPVAADGGGCYYNGKYYAVTYAGFMGMVLAEFCVYNAETWQQEKYIPTNAGSVSVDMDYDVTTGEIYGCFYNDSFDGFVFGRMDPNTGERKAICNLNRIFFGIAVNSKGQVYGLDEEGDLYLFNKVSGQRTKVGNTGLSPEYLCSATFDQKTGVLYQSISKEDGSWLYSIDTETAKATLVCKFPNNEELQGMYIPVPAAEPDAPAVATDLKAFFIGASLSGNFTFTMPTTTFGGTALQGELDYDVYLNDVQYISGKASAGEEVNVNVVAPLFGMYKLTVRPKNAVGQAPAAYISLWIGKDVPAAVSNLTVADGATTGEVVISWEAPTVSLHQGFLEPSSISYRIERFQGAEETGLVVATVTDLTYTDKIDNEGEMKPYHYVVTPLVDGRREGTSATSPSIGVGKALQLPYYQPFDDEHGMDLMTIVDRHGDGKTWEYDPTFQAARAQYDWTNAKNEWLITPPLHLTTGRVYTLNFDAWVRDGYSERMEVKMGQGKKYSDLKTQIVPRTDFKNGVPQNVFSMFKVEADGDYSFGFHALSDVDQWWLYLDNICIEEGPLLGTPNRVSNLHLKSGEKGALNATLTFTAPTVTVEDENLTSLDGIRIYREEDLLVTLVVQPGEVVTYMDDSAGQGMNHYRIVPVNGHGNGLEVSDSIYVGVDIPMAPGNVTLRKVNDKPVLTWEAPTKGVNDGYIDPEQVVYYIYRSDNAEIASQLSGLTFTDNTLELGDEQAFTTYAVYAQNVAGLDEEQVAMSNEVCFGNPFELPFKESFAGVTLEMGPWTWDIVKGDPWIKIAENGVYPNAQPQDQDGGLVTFEPDAEGDEAILYSANISLVGAQQPQLSFWYFNNPGSFDKISARVRIDDDPALVDEVAYINMTGTAGEVGWTNMTCDLNKYLGHRIQLAFVFMCNSDYSMHIDNICVMGLRQDLPCVTDLTAGLQGNTVLLSWTEPRDEQGLGFIGFNVYRDGELLNTDEPLIDPMYEDVLSDANVEHVYQVTVVYEEGETTYSNAVNQHGETVGIRGVALSFKNSVFNLGGQRLTRAPKHGVYIQNQKKLIK